MHKNNHLDSDVSILRNVNKDFLIALDDRTIAGREASLPASSPPASGD
jgi:hypothetical protein